MVQYCMLKLAFCPCAVLGILLLTNLTPLYAGPLTIIVDGGTTASDQTQPPTARYDFGSRKPTDDTPIAHTFLLHNSSKATVTITQLEASCGCTTAVLSEAKTLPAEVGADQNVSIEVNVSPHRLSPGPVHKTVWVYTADKPDQPAVMLEIDGQLQTEDTPTSESDTLPGQSRPSVLPQTGHLAPPFTLTDTTGKPFVLTATRGRPLALFFFCGCPWCAEVAKAWGQTQRGARLPASTETAVIFAGDKAAASDFAAKNGLDVSQTLLLPDPDSKVTETVYKSNSCPRAFVLDPKGVITYTNDHPDDQPRIAPAKIIVSHTLEALGQTEQHLVTHH